MKVMTVASALVLSVTVASALKLSRLGYESPRYAVVSHEGPFEIRDYPALTLVSTPKARSDPQDSSGFMRLFRYITGGNAEDQSIAMTTPVLTTREKSQWRVSFVVPTEVAEAGPPQPNDKEVELETMEAGRFAVYRFSGTWSSLRFEEAKRKLSHWIDQKGLDPIAEPQIANYDPPFTPAMLRRNEVLVRVAN